MTLPWRPTGDPTTGSRALPNLVIIGAMKCGTTALHRALGRHPQIAMSTPKELNFFFGPAHADVASRPSWVDGNRWRGIAWYASHFPAAAPVRGEASPGYTSPDHPRVAARLADLLPHVRLVYLVRDPIARALSQYRHHVRDGTETRPVDEALTDPDSQYLARSRYHERLLPFLDRFPRGQLLVVAQEDLRAHPGRTLRQVVTFAGADPALVPTGATRPSTATMRAPLDGTLRATLAAALRDDAARLRTVTGRDLPHWDV